MWSDAELRRFARIGLVIDALGGLFLVAAVVVGMLLQHAIEREAALRACAVKPAQQAKACVAAQR